MRSPKDILINGKQLSEILEAHHLWWRSQGGERANLYRANLSCANLYRANLSGANLSGANLSCADLYGANLYGADLSGANLSGADLYGANLSCADLSCADLSGADLYGANLSCAKLSGANLSGANLSCANLYRANLYRANLYRADLSGADLSGANLSCADLSGAKNIEQADAITRILPDGDLIVWKQAQTKDGAKAIIQLKIPAAAKRSNATGRKCRAEYAKDMKHFVDGKETKQKLYSGHNRGFVYEVGKVIRPDGFDENRWEECSSGVHFFITRWEAENY